MKPVVLYDGDVLAEALDSVRCTHCRTRLVYDKTKRMWLRRHFSTTELLPGDCPGDNGRQSRLHDPAGEPARLLRVLASAL